MMTSEEMVKQQFKYFEWYSDGGTTEIHWSDLERYLNLLRNQTLEETAVLAGFATDAMGVRIADKIRALKRKL